MPRAKARTPKRLNRSIKTDAVNPSDYLKYDFRFACEDCTHFNIEAESCTIGYSTIPHRKAEQEHCYRLSGKMAICRFLEID